MRHLCRGYGQNLDEIVNGALFTSNTREIVLVKNIELYSLCEHHMLPFIGKAHVAYLPNGKVLGLSKVARIVEMYARRLQIQENLSRQIAEAVQQVTNAAGVAVVLEAQHMHDDARRGKTELLHGHVRDAGRIPRQPFHPRRVPEPDPLRVPAVGCRAAGPALGPAPGGLARAISRGGCGAAPAARSPPNPSLCPGPAPATARRGRPRCACPIA